VISWFENIAVLSALLAVPSILTILLLALRYGKQFGLSLSGESSRKLVHLLMGLVCLSFPFVFSDPAPVNFLALLICLFFLALRVSPGAAELRKVLFSVDRFSLGEMFFPIAVATIFNLASAPLYYLVPMAVLALADSVAALVGERFGAHIYRLQYGAKSLEGSLAFWLAAMLAGLSLLVFCGVGVVKAILVAVLLACMACVVEAISFGGADNLLIPVSILFILEKALPLPEPNLAVQVVIFAVLTLAVLTNKERSSLNDGATLGSLVFLYFVFTEGGAAYLLMPLILLFSYKRLLPRRFRYLSNRHGGPAILCFIPVLLFLFLPALTKRFQPADLLSAYGLAFAIHGAIIGSAHISLTSKRKVRTFLLIINTLKSWSLLFLPSFIIGRGTAIDLSICLTALSGLMFVFSATFIFACFTKAADADERIGRARWFKQGALAYLGSFVYLMAV
jgi:phytol kinase